MSALEWQSSTRALDGVPAPVATTVAAPVTTEIVTSRQFTIIDLANTQKTLEEQAFQKTDCAVQIGKLLAAEKILVCAVSRLGSRYSITVQLVDVERGNVDLAATGDSPSAESPDQGVKKLVGGVMALLR